MFVVHEAFEGRNERMRLETRIVLPEPGIKLSTCTRSLLGSVVSVLINLILEQSIRIVDMGVKLTSQVPWEMGAEWRTTMGFGTKYL